MTRRRLTVTYVLVGVRGGGVVSAGNRRAARLRGQEYDIVLAGGHVLDPETGLDATRHVGIQGGRIAAVTTELPAARETLDVSGLMVTPGFIDLHAHGQDSESYRDRKSTRLNSSHSQISYAVFCLKKKKKQSR